MSSVITAQRRAQCSSSQELHHHAALHSAAKGSMSTQVLHAAQCARCTCSRAALLITAAANTVLYAVVAAVAVAALAATAVTGCNVCVTHVISSFANINNLSSSAYSCLWVLLSVAAAQFSNKHSSANDVCSVSFTRTTESQHYFNQYSAACAWHYCAH
jgi:hypothetical protein